MYNSICCICFSHISSSAPKICSCSEKMHVSCLRTWNEFSKKSNCPNCRQLITIYPNTRNEAKFDHILKKWKQLLDKCLEENTELTNFYYICNMMDFIWENRILIRKRESLKKIVIERIEKMKYMSKYNFMYKKMKNF